MKQHKNKYLIKPVFYLVGSLVLTGCQSMVWPDYLRPQVATPDRYVELSQNAAQNQIANDWWTLYQDETLNTLIANALKHNTDIKAAVANIEQADAVMKEAGTFLIPSVNLDGAGTRSRVTEAGAFPVFSANPRNNFNIKLGTTFELDFWGKLGRAKESARASALSSRYAKDTVTLSLTGLVASQYLTLRSLEKQIQIAEQNLVSRDASLALTKRRLEGGIVSALDVHQAEVANTNLRAQIADLKRLQSLSLNQLALLTGDLDLAVRGLGQTKADIMALPIPPVPPLGLPSSLLESRPDVRQAEQQMVAANANIAVAKAALYPSISLTANWGGESLELKDILSSAARIWTGGLGLSLPIFNGGRLNARVDQEAAKQKKTLATYERTIQTAFTEVNDALISLRQQTEREQSLLISQTSAQKMLTLSENRYQSGYSAYIEVLDAQRTYNDASLAFVQARQARLIATVDLFKVLGGGWQAQPMP
ncbi:efflux transporter outer membrane subunit [Methylotenera mobilis]|uniref:RND efflux system, outer membrane lipoprotein, NodT family n=1 Tax=Methylotenera mobilis (strain JLW8 / ATCC BAA-1282 / DSM 17540) TaxID=583345 RepID=C6WV47_METML|nr:efflux transporter outer membrane subunit [Methylotenera mobilis]ACT47796.1 RND efflux system, outer membrane lipoprotein, NodT family [Methylotenera mobilis JLW8]